MPPTATASSSSPEGWIVLKFGGTSVSRRVRWDTIGRLMTERAGEGARVLVVVSALSGVTNELQALCEKGIADAAFAHRIDALVERHRAYAAELGVDADAVLGERFAALRALVDDVRRQDAALDWQAELLAQGELLSSTLGVAYLRSQGVDAGWVDARNFLRAVALPNQNAWSRRLSVSCEYSASATVNAGLASFGKLLVTQGFIARGEDGSTAILGRGGSDTSAAYFGALLGARRVEIWTDVPGMFSANPRAVPDARLLTRLDYEEAQEIATTGAKVLHPRCIHPCREARVPIHIRDTERPGFAGTSIDDRAATLPGVKAISTRRGIVLVSMETIGMWQQVGFLADVFERFKRAGLSIDLIGSSEANVTVSLDPSDNLVSSNVLDALCADLAEVCRVKVIAPCSAVTLVGRGMRSLLHKLTDVWGEFGRERVHLVSQSSNDLNLTFVVDESVADDLLPRLHALLIQSGAMPVDAVEVFGPSWRQIATPPPVRTPPWWRAKRDALLALAQHGTPRYAYDLPTVRARARALAGVTAVDRRLYALKANAHPELLRALHVEGFGFECVSLAEVERVFAAVPGIDPAMVLFTPSFAPRAEIATALARGVNVTIDNVGALRDWAELFAGRGIFLRLDPGFGAGHHAKVRTGGKEAKFGLSPESLDAAVAAARAAGAKVVGLHAHIGSGIFEASHWAQVYALLARLADRIGTVRHLDIGGGLGVSYDGDDAGFDLPGYAAALAQLKADYPQYSLWIEPGRYLVAEAGVLLARVTQVVTKDGVRRIGLDAGMNALIRPALYDAFHGIVNLSRVDAPDGVPAEIVGPICESSDVLGHRRRLPDSTAEGDVIVVEHAGAYGFAMANQYNLRALPAEEVLDASLPVDGAAFDRESIRAFRFVDCTFDAATGEARLAYAFDDGAPLVEALRFPGAPFALDAARSTAVTQALRLLHLIAGVSYYKAAVPPEIRIDGHAIDAGTAALLTEVYENGLGEFAYRNGLELRGKIVFPHAGDSAVAAGVAPAPAPALGLRKHALVAIGGGKDSLVSIEALRAAGIGQTVTWIGASPLIRACAERTGLPLLNITRSLAPELFELNKRGALNGHIPVTAVNSVILALAALLVDADQVVFSNERSASYGSLIPGTGEVNHQWSKGWAFERDFAAQLARNVAADLRYYSLLRPFSELAVARQFARRDRYDAHFSSCNRNFHLLGDRPAQRWCGVCPKCHFVFLALAPFMPKPRLLNIFGRNLLDEPEQAPGFDALLEYQDHKPFECVGEGSESRAAMAFLADSASWREDALVARFQREIRPQLDAGELQLAPLLESEGPHGVPADLWEALRAHF